MREEENEIRGEKLNLGDEVQTFISLCRHVSVDSAGQWSSLETCAFQVIINIDSTITSVEVGGGLLQSILFSCEAKYVFLVYPQ